MSERRKIGTRIAGMAKQAGLLAAVFAALAGSRGAHASPLAPIQPEAARPASAISGDYLEARTADVYTGPCFANSEIDLVGKQAVVAWRVRQGAWQGVQLDGLAVVAAVRASSTLGDPAGGPVGAEALLVVDRRATPAQRDALVAFARSMGGDLLASVVGVETAPIEMTVGGAAASSAGEAHHHPLAPGLAVAGISGAAHLKAGDWVDLTTRGIGPQDHLCGNEEVYYPPLTAARSQVTAVPAVTTEYDFRGPGLGMAWSSPGKRSAFVGHFAR